MKKQQQLQQRVSALTLAQEFRARGQEELALAVLATMLFQAMRDHPSPDLWSLVQRATESQMVAMGAVREDVNAVFQGLGALSAQAAAASPWPKGFF